MQENTWKTIMWLSRVIRWICGKIINPNEMPIFKEDVATTLCMLEMEMPPSFFDVMTHLMLHLVEELDVCGSAHIRWMYYIEQMNKVLKGYV
jgi:hypothetical protein